METNKANSEFFDENQSLQVIREMIEVSQKKLKNDGILFILWGWLGLYNYISGYILEQVVSTYQIRKIHDYFGTGIFIIAFVFSLYYVFKQSKKVQTYIGISLRYVWLSLVVCLSLTNMIIYNTNHVINFNMQHPIFMVFIAFATVITGGILRYRLVIFGGVIFGILAYSSSYFKLPEQMLFEAAAWLIAFIIPGHILYSKRNS
jgi:hypothetical protein